MRRPYNLDAVAYESIMLGIYQIHLGPPIDQLRPALKSPR